MVINIIRKSMLLLLVIFLSQYCKGNNYEDSLSKRKEFINKWILPDHYKIQYAGNIGFFSVSFGKTYNPKIQTDLFYGYIPETIFKRHIHTVACKITFSPFHKELKNRIFSPIAGTSVNFAFSHKIYKTDLPHYFPSGYYSNQWIHVNPFVGLRAKKIISEENRNLKAIDFYCEIGTVDMYLWYFITTNELKFISIWNLAIGTTFYF